MFVGTFLIAVGMYIFCEHGRSDLVLLDINFCAGDAVSPSATAFLHSNSALCTSVLDLIDFFRMFFIILTAASVCPLLL